MAIGDNAANVFRDLTNDLSKWDSIGSITGVSSTPATDDKIRAALKKSTILESSYTQRQATAKHIDAFVRSFSHSKPEATKEALSTLLTLRSMLIAVANSEVFKDLETVGLKDVKDERRGIAEQIAKIDTVIFDIGSTLQSQSKNKENHEATSPIASLKDPEQNQVIAKKMQTDPDVARWPEDFKNPELIPGILIQKALQGTSATSFSPSDEEMPTQLKRDLPSLAGFSVNGKTEFSTTATYELNPKTAYKNFCAACRTKVGEEQGNRVAYTIGAIMNQGFFADLMSKVMLLDVPHPKDVTIFPTGGEQLWSVNLRGDNVVITLKTVFAYKDPIEPKSDYGAFIAKRQVEIPVSELMRTDLATKPLTNVAVTDTYSRHISSAAYADVVLPYF